MAYTDFTLGNVGERLGVTLRYGPLFDAVTAAAVPTWLPPYLETMRPFARISGKARCEYMIAPLLGTLRTLVPQVMVISGQQLVAEEVPGLNGVTDFLVARTPFTPMLESPIITVVEAKGDSAEEGFGQCIAQMVAARYFNERAGRPTPRMYGASTTGDDWNFMYLEAKTAMIDTNRHHLNDLGSLLGVLVRIVGEFPVPHVGA